MTLSIFSQVSPEYNVVPKINSTYTLYIPCTYIAKTAVTILLVFADLFFNNKINEKKFSIVLGDLGDARV